MKLKDFDGKVVNHSTFLSLIKDTNCVKIEYEGVVFKDITYDWYTLYLIDGEEVEIYISRTGKVNLSEFLCSIYHDEHNIVVYVEGEYSYEGKPAEIHKVLTCNLMSKLKVVYTMTSENTIYIDTEVINND